jgi:hypothetical protein
MKKYYCGPFWCPLWAKKILSKYFNEACYLHDEDYRLQYGTQKEADDNFLKRMMDSSSKTYLAIVFYFAVRLLGWISWKKSKKEHSK